MTYWCNKCYQILRQDDVNIKRYDETFTAPWGNIMVKNEQYSEEAYCPDCGDELEEHIE